MDKKDEKICNWCGEPSEDFFCGQHLCNKCIICYCEGKSWAVEKMTLNLQIQSNNRRKKMSERRVFGKDDNKSIESIRNIQISPNYCDHFDEFDVLIEKIHPNESQKDVLMGKNYPNKPSNGLLSYISSLFHL